jgi:hypothetical protein
MDSTLNVSPVDDAIATILANPETHDQEFWGRRTICGTTMCLAGHIVVQAGWLIKFERFSLVSPSTSTADRCYKDGRFEDIEEQARIEAGLTGDEAQRLFYCFGGVEQLAQRWKEIKQEHGL